MFSPQLTQDDLESPVKKKKGDAGRGNDSDPEWGNTGRESSAASGTETSHMSQVSELGHNVPKRVEAGTPGLGKAANDIAVNAPLQSRSSTSDDEEAAPHYCRVCEGWHPIGDCPGGTDLQRLKTLRKELIRSDEPSERKVRPHEGCPKFRDDSDRPIFIDRGT